MKVKTLIITGYGINCERESAECFFRAGSETEIIHINQLILKPQYLAEFHLLALPGGFSFGDHISSGRIFANKLRFFLWQEITDFILAGKGIIGICNGFQVLIKSGLLPGPKMDTSEFSQFSQPIQFAQEYSITHNENGRFEDRWVSLNINQDNPSFWLNGFGDLDVELPIRHGEGRFVIKDNEQLENILSNQLVALTYQDEIGQTTMKYPNNPNGSIAGIAGLTNQAGNVFGLMPHPEAYMTSEHPPNFQIKKSRELLPTTKDLKTGDGLGMQFFYNGVQAMKNKFKLK